MQHQIEIHNTPQESNEESSLNEELSALTSDPGDDEVFLDNDSGKNFCLFNLDNNLKDKAQDLASLPTTNKKCSCVLCVNRESLKSNMSNCSSVQPLKHRTSFRNSLKCLIEMVGKTNKFFMPLQRKRSFSLTDVDKGGRRKIRL